MPSAGSVLAFVGKGAQAYTAYESGRSMARGFKYARRASGRSVAEIRKQAAYRSWLTARGIDAAMGSMKAGYSGDVNLAGSAMEVLANNLEALSLDKLMQERNARIAEREKLAEARHFRKMEKSAKKQSVWGAIGNLF